MSEKQDIDQLTKEVLSQGGIQALLYFDIHGGDPEILKNMMVQFLSKITKTEGVAWSYGEIEPPIKSEDGLYSSMAEVKVLVRSFEVLIFLSLNFAPIGVEVVKPENQIKLNLNEVHRVCLNLSEFSHMYTDLYLNKVLKGDDKVEYYKKFKAREELGKQLREKFGTNKDNTKNDNTDNGNESDNNE